MSMLAAVALTGCSLPPPALRVRPTYGPDAYKMAEPKSAAFHDVCAKKGGHVIGQDCVIQTGGGIQPIRIFDDEVK